MLCQPVFNNNSLIAGSRPRAIRSSATRKNSSTLIYSTPHRAENSSLPCPALPQRMHTRHVAALSLETADSQHSSSSSSAIVTPHLRVVSTRASGRNNMQQTDTQEEQPLVVSWLSAGGGGGGGAAVALDLAGGGVG